MLTNKECHWTPQVTRKGHKCRGSRDCCSFSPAWCTFPWSPASWPAHHPCLWPWTVLVPLLSLGLTSDVTSSWAFPQPYNATLWSPRPHRIYLISVSVYAQSRPIRKQGSRLLGIGTMHQVEFLLATEWTNEWIPQGELAHSLTH